MNDAASEKRSAPLISALDSLLAAASAFKNVRAIALMGLTFVSAILVMAVFTFLANAMSTGIVAMLGAILAFLVVFYGANGVGIMMMREAQGEPTTGIVDAVLLSLFSSHRLIAVAFLEGLIVLAAVLAVALLLLVCKIPAVGPILFTFVFPVSAVVLGMLVFALFYVMLPLAGPAVWSGSNTFQVLARLNALGRSKIVPVISQQFILFFIVMFVSGIIFTIVILGMLLAGVLSVPIVGAGGGGFGSMVGGLTGHGGGMPDIDGASYGTAMSIGGGLLFAVAAVIPSLIMTKGVCLIYLNVTSGMDFEKAEAQLQSGMASVKKKADEARERARQLADQNKLAPAAAVAPSPVVSAPQPAQSTQSACPKCHASVTADDVFCGDCGYKLK